MNTTLGSPPSEAFAVVVCFRLDVAWRLSERRPPAVHPRAHMAAPHDESAAAARRSGATHSFGNSLASSNLRHSSEFSRAPGVHAKCMVVD